VTRGISPSGYVQLGTIQTKEKLMRYLYDITNGELIPTNLMPVKGGRVGKYVLLELTTEQVQAFIDAGIVYIAGGKN